MLPATGWGRARAPATPTGRSGPSPSAAARAVATPTRRAPGRRRRLPDRRPQAPSGRRGGHRATRRTGMALVDAAHWATEAPWLDRAGRATARTVRHYGGRLECPRTVTDPWTLARTLEPPNRMSEQRERRSRRPTAAARPAGRRHRPGPARPPARARCPSWLRIAERDRARPTYCSNEVVDAADPRSTTSPSSSAGWRTRSTPSARAPARDEQRLARPAGCRPRSSRACSTRSLRWPGARSTLEDDLLEMMEQREDAEARAERLTSAAGRDRLAERAQLEQRRDAAFAEIDVQAADRTQRAHGDRRRDPGRPAGAVREGSRAPAAASAPRCCTSAAARAAASSCPAAS